MKHFWIWLRYRWERLWARRGDHTPEIRMLLRGARRQDYMSSGIPRIELPVEKLPPDFLKED